MTSSPYQTLVFLLGGILGACGSQPEAPSDLQELTIVGQIRDSLGAPIPYVFLSARLISGDSVVGSMFAQSDANGTYRASTNMPFALTVDSVWVVAKRPNCEAISPQTDLFFSRPWASLQEQLGGARQLDVTFPIRLQSASAVRGPACAVGIDSTTHGLGTVWYLFTLWSDSVQSNSTLGVAVIQGRWGVNFLQSTPRYDGTFRGTVALGIVSLDVIPNQRTDSLFCSTMRFTGVVSPAGEWGPLTTVGPTCFPQQQEFLFIKGDSVTTPWPL